MPGFGAFVRGLFKEGFFTLIIECLKWLFAIGSPIVVAAVTIAAGALQGTPIAYIIAAATFAAASMVTFLLRFDEWRAKRIPANKLALGVPQVVFDYTRDSTGEITGVEYAQIAMLLNNTATFGISYIIDEISCSLDGHVNQDAKLILKASCRCIYNFIVKTVSICVAHCSSQG